MSQIYNKVSLIGMFGAISIVLGIMENYIPFPVPGIRLGLANLGVMIMLYTGGIVPAFIVMLLKIVLVPILSGNFIFKISLAAPAGVVAFIGMAIAFKYFKNYVSPISIGVIGALLHMLTQLFVADKLYIKGIFASSILGWFLLLSVFAGVLTGVITMIVTQRIKKIFSYNLFVKNDDIVKDVI